MKRWFCDKLWAKPSALTAFVWIWAGAGVLGLALMAGISTWVLAQPQGVTVTIVGAAQNITVPGDMAIITAVAGASLSTISAPLSGGSCRLTLVFDNANVTVNDADAGGAANTIDLAGLATNFVGSDDDTLTLVFLRTPSAGNARWLQVERAVN